MRKSQYHVFVKKIFLSVVLSFLTLTIFAIIGNTNTSTSTDTIGTVINASRFLANSNMTVDRITARVTGISGSYRTAIYTGSASYPSNFLVGSSAVSAPTSGWYVFPLTSPTSLSVNNNYWLATWSSVNGSVYYTTGGTLRWNTNTYTFGSWPATLPTAAGATFNYSIYASDVIVTNIINPPPSTNIVFAFNWTNSAKVTRYELWSTTNLTFPFTILTNLGLMTNYTLLIPKATALPQQFFKLVAYTSSGGTNKSVTLAWDASPDPSVVGYRLYMGDTNFNYFYSTNVGNVLTSRVDNLLPSTSYSFGAKSYNALGVESEFSNQIIHTTSDGSVVTSLVDWPCFTTITY